MINKNKIRIHVSRKVIADTEVQQERTCKNRKLTQSTQPLIGKYSSRKLFPFLLLINLIPEKQYDTKQR